jgi:diguanylate cyclase (GGDEF)-like protein/PAS domain S-box-containing protein
MVDPGGTVRYASPAFGQVLGYDPDDAVGTNILDHVHPEDLPHVLEETEKALSEGGIVSNKAEYRYRHKDGSWRWIESVSTYLLDDPAVGAVVVSSRDVTERKEAEEALSQAEKRFRSLVQNSSDVITLVDAEGTVRYVSPTIERVLGCRPEDRIGGNSFEMLHPDALQRANEAFAEALRRPSVTRTIELRVSHQNGSWRHVEVAGTNLLDDPSIRGIVFNWRDITERKALEGRLQHQAFYDPLTDLPNRQLFVDRLRQAFKRTRRQRNRVAVLFMDLDGFKMVNDSLGHELGDRLLVAVVERLRSCLRPEDTLARFGGDEVVVLLEDVQGPEDPVRVAECLVEALLEPFLLHGREVFVTVSIGIALSGTRWKRPEELLRDADTAMYEAKNEAVSGYRVFDPSMRERILSRLKLENDLRRAMEVGEFVVRYQPIVSLGSGEVRGMEALVRWEHPERGLLEPSTFVPTIEERGFIVLVGEKVLGEACHRAREWQEEALAPRRWASPLTSRPGSSNVRSWPRSSKGC